MVDVLNRSTGGNHATKNKLEQFVLSGTFASGFGLRLMVKDMQIALGLAHDEQLEVPLGDRAGELWAAAAEALPADADHTAIARAIGLVSEERPQAA
jgi:3-hydroxyisobutyrate dehydrogenase